MRIIVCFKLIAEESEIEVRGDRTISTDNASLVISPYDCNAMEAAMKLAAGYPDAEVFALTVGGERVENGKMRKAALSRGPAQFFAVKDASLDTADSFSVASALKAAIAKLGGADIIICGEGSGDQYKQQTGVMLGCVMGLPAVNAVSKLSPDGDKLVIERSIEDGVDILELSLPAVVSVTSDICPSRIPSMKEILGAGKKPVTIYSLVDVEVSVERRVESLSVLVPDQTDRKQQVVKGDSDDDVKAFYELIQKAIR